MIEHKNIIYIRDFTEIGGVETFTYELAKEYKDLDIAVVYKTAHPNQLKRLKKICPFYKHTNQEIKCKVAIINYDTTIIPYICEEAKIYQVVHGDYENKAYEWKPPTHPRITAYIGITKHIQESFKRITGKENVIMSYNPLDAEPDRPLLLISGTRISKIKGKDRMIKLAEELDKQGINYKWLVFTNDKEKIPSKNVTYLEPDIDFTKWLELADYLVQLSDTEACSYSINEALYRNIPVIVTPLPYLKEIGVENNKNALIIKFDCSNIKEVVQRIKDKPEFNFKHLKDSYNKLLYKSKSKYKLDGKNICMRVMNGYYDKQEQKGMTINDILFVDQKRAEELVQARVARIE